MTITATNQADLSGQIVNLMLNGGRVTAGFREALFDAAARDGVSVNEYVLRSAATRLLMAGERFPGVFHAGDIDHQNDNQSKIQRRTA